MRIVDVCAFYTPHGGGVRTYVHRKLAAAAAAGHEMIVLAPGADYGRTAFEGGVVATIPAPRLPMDRRYRYFSDEAALHRALDAWQPDVVEASSPWSSAAMVARWPRSATRSLIMHADPLSAYAYRWFGSVASVATIDRGFDWFWRHLRQLDSAMDLVVSASGDLSHRLIAGGLTKVKTLPMGVEPGVFAPTHRDQDLRARLLARCELPPSATLLLGIGRYSPEKRWPMVIDAAIAAGSRSPVGLLLIGEGRVRGKLEARAAGSPHVVVGEAIADRGALAAIMASGDALVHGCEAETFCMVGAEAAASGLPIIAPDRGGAVDHVRGFDGGLYRSGDSAGLRDAIARFVDRRDSKRTSPSRVRTMDDHFNELFHLYGTHARPLLHAA
ncbi:glycosyltransferase family 1 protein [Sphingomonas sp. S-NIH.Pt1_0416]|uniref:glycosyltransferase n=1 Tax=Sphingomonas sp. S-NIH.Pt1_0416 TaxID=1920123 RepID=UPI000F7D7B07|nr:glycosyltransferase [Sphingomonas sp. S-NIH.Pt1_0416]RSU65264.1 glycosyltransferase family 1 protein [Sphingomonas sp. S-NIH.Pt1_0416]